MEPADLTLLVALDALLEHNSVTVAAQRLHTSPSAMSRTLSRLRRAFGDPLLVRAGRDLVPTPRALAVRAEVRAIVERAATVFEAPDDDLAGVRRTFDLQTQDLLVDVLTPALVAAARAEAPGITLRFRPEPLEGSAPLRANAVDLEVGVIDRPEPELRVAALARLRLVALVAPDHPLRDGPVTAARFAAAPHVVVSRRGRAAGPVDDRLAELGLTRRVVAVVPGFSSAVALARRSDVVCLGVAPPEAVALGMDAVQAGLSAVEVPLALDHVPLSMAWHPRLDADPAHRWLRDQVRRRLGGRLGAKASVDGV